VLTPTFCWRYFFLRRLWRWHRWRWCGCDNGFWPTCADEFWPTPGGWTGSAAPRGGTACQRRFFSFLFMICSPCVAPWCGGSGRSPCRW
jgi:hypothetical protein